VQHLTHWDEVEPRRREAGHLAGTWRDLGRAAGTQGVGVQRIDVDPGRWSTPAHVEGASEEIFYVLAGSGISWQDGAGVAEGIDDSGDLLVRRLDGDLAVLGAGEVHLRL